MPTQRDNVYHAVAFTVGDNGSDGASRLVQCFLMCRNQGRLLQLHLVLQQSQAQRRASKGCPNTMLQFVSFMTSRAQNLSRFREARPLQATKMTPEREDSQVLSGKGCHVHDAEFPTDPNGSTTTAGGTPKSSHCLGWKWLEPSGRKHGTQGRAHTMENTKRDNTQGLRLCSFVALRLCGVSTFRLFPSFGAPL